MGVIATEIKIGSWRGKFGEDGRVSYTLRVETDDVADGPFSIYESPLVPKIGSVYDLGNEAAPLYLCKTVSPKVDENDKTLWELEIEYEEIDLEELEDEEEEEEIRATRLFDFDSSFRYEKRPMLQDLDGKYLRNTAGEEYSKPLEKNVKILVFNIRRKEFANPINRQVLYQDAVNSVPFWGQAAGQVLVESFLSSGRGKGNKTTGWNVKYSIAIRPRSAGRWDEIEVPSMGFNEKFTDGDSSESKLKEIINKATGKAFMVEQYLNAQGKWLDRLASGFQPHLDKYRIRERLDLSAMRLPDLTALVYSAQLDDQTGDTE